MDDDSAAGLRIILYYPRSQIHPLFLKKSLKTLKLIVTLRKQLFNVTMLGRGTKSHLQPQLHPWVLVLGDILNINMCYAYLSSTGQGIILQSTDPLLSF